MLTICFCRPLSAPLVKTMSTFAFKCVPDTQRWQQQSLNEECKEMPSWSYIFKTVRCPNHSIPLLCVVGLLDFVSDSCHTTHTSSPTMYSPHLQRAPFCHFLPAASLLIFPLKSLPHSLCSLSLSHTFFLCISLFHLWPILFIGSLIFLALTLLSLLQSSSISLPSLAWPFLICFFFFCLCLAFVKEYQKVVVSVVSLSISVRPLCRCLSLSMSLSALQIILLGCLPG